MNTAKPLYNELTTMYNGNLEQRNKVFHLAVFYFLMS